LTFSSGERPRALWALLFPYQCVTAVKCRPVLQHCVVIFSGPQGSWILHFNNKVPLMRWEVSVVWYLSLPLMNILNKTEAAIFHCRLCFLRAFPFISFIYYFIIIFIFGVTPLYLDVIYTKYVLMCGRCHKIAIIEATLFVTPLYVRGQICMKSLDTTWQYTLRMIFVKIYPRYDWFLII